MGDVVNLRLARKAKARTQSVKAAEQARAKSGESKPARLARLREADRAARELDGAKRESD